MMVSDSQEKTNGNGHTEAKTTGAEAAARMDYYQARIPVPYDVIYAVLGVANPDISKIINPADKEFEWQKRIATGRTQGTDEDKLFAANFVYDEIQNKNPDFVRNIFNHIVGQIDPSKKQTIHIPVQVRQSMYEEKLRENKKHAKNDLTALNVNTLAVITSMRLAEDLQAMAKAVGFPHLKFAADRMLIEERLSADRRGDADIIGRFVIQSKFDVSQFKKDELVFVADDVVQAGTMGAAAVTALQNQQCKILGIGALTCPAETQKLQANYELRNGLNQTLRLCFEATNKGIQYTKEHEERYKKDFADALALVGLSVESLTNREVLMAMALLLDKNDQEHQQFFERMKRAAGVDPKIIEGRDALVISDIGVTPKGFGAILEQRIDDLVQKGMPLLKQQISRS